MNPVTSINRPANEKKEIVVASRHPFKPKKRKKMDATPQKNPIKKREERKRKIDQREERDNKG